MTLRSVGALMLTTVLIAGCGGQGDGPPDPSREETRAEPSSSDPVTSIAFAVPVPTSASVRVEEETFTSVDGPRPVDVYLPQGAETPPSTVLLVQGPQPGANRADPIVAWARLLARSGLSVVVVDYAGTEQVDSQGDRDLAAGIDVAVSRNRLAPVDRVLGLSAGGPYAVRAASKLTSEGKAAFLYARVEPTAPAAPEQPAQYSLSRVLSRPGAPHALVAYGRQDPAPGILLANRRFVERAGTEPVRMLTHPGGHAFELTADDSQAAAIVQRTLRFLGSS